MSKVIREPAYYDQMAKDALEWGARYHSSQRILQVLLNGYARFIPSAAPANAILDMTNKTSVVA